MMFELLKNYKGPLTVNEVRFESIEDAQKEFHNFVGSLRISINVPDTTQMSAKEKAVHQAVEEGKYLDDKEYIVKVRKYMTNPEFDFHRQWNEDKPMPMRLMVGRIMKETKGMYLMELHGQVLRDLSFCMKCGRTLTNPVSKYFGIGPECGGHGYHNPFETEEELKAAIKNVRKQLQNITWTGWVIKKAIELWEVYDEDEET